MIEMMSFLQIWVYPRCNDLTIWIEGLPRYLMLEGLAMSTPDTLTSSNFDRIVLNSDKVYLVSFWATWCRPCRSLSHILDEIAEEYDKVLSVGKINVESYPELASHYEVLSIPTMLLFKEGKLVKTLVGSSPKASILEHIKPVLE